MGRVPGKYPFCICKDCATSTLEVCGACKVSFVYSAPGEGKHESESAVETRTRTARVVTSETGRAGGNQSCHDRALGTRHLLALPFSSRAPVRTVRQGCARTGPGRRSHATK